MRNVQFRELILSARSTIFVIINTGLWYYVNVNTF
jgi:hypothetical protein